MSWDPMEEILPRHREPCMTSRLNSPTGPEDRDELWHERQARLSAERGTTETQTLATRLYAAV